MLHTAVMQPKGMAPVLQVIDQMRRDRYMDLLECAFELVDIKEAAAKKTYHRSVTLMDISEYMKKHKVFQDSYAYELWMHYSSPYVLLDQKLRGSLEVRRCFRFDGTYKIGKKMIVFDESNRRVKPDESKVLLLLLNEIGQWVSFCFSDGEKNEDLEAMLRSCSCNVLPSVADSIWVVCDNATRCRSVVDNEKKKHGLMKDGPLYTRFTIKQDPMHVPDRFKRHCKVDAKRDVSDLIKSAMWNEGRLRAKHEMEKHLKKNCEIILNNGWVLSGQEESFNRTLMNNLQQIRHGDLDYEGQNPTHHENGREYSVLSTSQVGCYFYYVIVTVLTIPIGCPGRG